LKRHSIACSELLERAALAVTSWAGSSWAFALAVGIVAGWAVSGPLFRFSDTWQLVINTGTTIVTFLMVFLIQRTQNKDSRAIHLKLNEIVAGLEGASNRLINVEDLTEVQVRQLHDRYEQVAKMAVVNGGPTASHSIEEAVIVLADEPACDAGGAGPRGGATGESRPRRRSTHPR
jgi:low affinity Fe/Cu permease